MGNDPNDFEIGNACTACQGGVFEEDETPEYIALEAEGIIRLDPDWPPPLNGVRLILKQAGYCFWSLDALIQEIEIYAYAKLYLSPHDTRFVIQDRNLGKYQFEGQDSTGCLLELDGLPDEPGPNDKYDYRNATAHINWGPGINEAAYLAQSIAH
jgi:hypothetical protein